MSMGPTCEILLPSEITDQILSSVDAYLRRTAEIVRDTRKGCFWEIWVDGRPISVSAHAGDEISFSAGCNSDLDYSLLRRISGELAAELGGIASEPVK